MWPAACAGSWRCRRRCCICLLHRLLLDQLPWQLPRQAAWSPHDQVRHGPPPCLWWWHAPPCHRSQALPQQQGAAAVSCSKGRCVPLCHAGKPRALSIWCWRCKCASRNAVLPPSFTAGNAASCEHLTRPLPAASQLLATSPLPPAEGRTGQAPLLAAAYVGPTCQAGRAAGGNRGSEQQ